MRKRERAAAAEKARAEQRSLIYAVNALRREVADLQDANRPKCHCGHTASKHRPQWMYELRGLGETKLEAAVPLGGCGNRWTKACECIAYSPPAKKVKP